MLCGQAECIKSTPFRKSAEMKYIVDLYNIILVHDRCLSGAIATMVLKLVYKNFLTVFYYTESYSLMCTGSHLSPEMDSYAASKSFPSPSTLLYVGVA